MKLRKSPAELIDLIADMMAGIECEKRLMFGFPAYFINKNMFAGLFEDKLFFRLSPQQVESLRGCVLNLEPMPGRPMKDYWVIAPVIRSDRLKLKRIAIEAAEYARGLPPKKKKASRKTSPRKNAQASK